MTWPATFQKKEVNRENKIRLQNYMEKAQGTAIYYVKSGKFHFEVNSNREDNVKNRSLYTYHIFRLQRLVYIDIVR